LGRQFYSLCDDLNPRRVIIYKMTSETQTTFPIQGSDAVKVYADFQDMSLIPDQLLRGIYAHGFEKPSEIQKRGIMPIAEGRDVIAQAQSGTGKTGTFTIGSMCRIDPKLDQVQVLVIVPTHELAKQHYDTAVGVGAYMKVKVHAARGKHPVREDIKAIQDGCQFLVGTPGRIYDLCHRGVLKRDHIQVLILDEADQMLEDRFQEQVLAILSLGFPKTTRVCLFSATWPPEIVKFTDGILQDPVRILIEKTSEVPLAGIKQYFVPLDQEEWKFETLCDVYSQLTINQCMIFCNKQSRADWLAMKMKSANFTLECLHGGMAAEERDKKMDDFRKGSCRVLITTDIMARGIDVQQVETVINFDVPLDKANYIHRIGRAARYGRKGTTINFVGPNEARQQEEIESYWHTKWEPLPRDLSTVGV
jgi:superfamily II DNA/RNA helicase